MDNVSLFSEARSEYLKQLSSWIVPPLVEFFMREYTSLAAVKGRGAMAAFQTFCSEVPRWNQDVIDSNIGVILDNCRCDYVDELMTAVFIAHTKMLTSIRVSGKQKKLQITLPKLDHFLHRVFVECARAFWKAPFLFDTALSPVELQKNVLQAETMCADALSAAIRSLLPVKNILRDYLDDDEEAGGAGLRRGASATTAEDDSSSSDEDEEEKPQKSSAAKKRPAAASVPEPTPNYSIEKLDAVMKEPVATAASEHVTSMPVIKAVEITKEPGPSKPSVIESIDGSTNPNPPKLLIETEPSVHFTPYDTVYDENSNSVSEIRFAPKVSVEDKPPSTWGMDVGGGDDEEDEEAPRLTLSASEEAIGLDEIEDLDAPSLPTPVSAVPEPDIDAPLGTTGDFETLE
jgi:hypothetical protein